MIIQCITISLLQDQRVYRRNNHQKTYKFNMIYKINLMIIVVKKRAKNTKKLEKNLKFHVLLILKNIDADYHYLPFNIEKNLNENTNPTIRRTNKTPIKTIRPINGLWTCCIRYDL